MGDFKMDGYATFYMALEMSKMRKELIKFYMDLMDKYPERFDSAEFAKGFALIDCGTIMMEKALFVEEEEPTGD